MLEQMPVLIWRLTVSEFELLPSNSSSHGQNSVISFYGVGGNCLSRPTSRCILFDGQNISFDANLVIYINSTNIPPIMIINKIYEHQNLLSL
jgi:hypothetical protein